MQGRARIRAFADIASSRMPLVRKPRNSIWEPAVRELLLRRSVEKNLNRSWFCLGIFGGEPLIVATQ
jgi:hypothetical protein